MQLEKTSKKKESLINEVKTFSNGYFCFNNIDCFSVSNGAKLVRIP